MRIFMTGRRDTLAFAVMGYHVAMPTIVESLYVVQGKVDEIVVTGDDFTDDDIKTLQSFGKVFIEPWMEHFSDYKNRLLSHVSSDWVVICDHDEIPTEEMANNLRRLVEESEHGEKYNIVGFDSINETTMLDGTVQTNRGAGKELLHETVYNCYHGEVHVWLNQSVHEWKGIRVNYAYRHVKTEAEILERAIRNIWLGGGGDTWKEKNPLWVPLRNITDRLEIRNYRELLAYLQVDDIDKELEEWIEKAYSHPWHDDELKAFKRYREVFHVL